MIFEYKEVAKHNSVNDAWIIINNNVYDITKYIDKHPGGKAILISSLGQDVTEEFKNIHHSSNAHTLMEKYCIGKIDNSSIPVSKSKTRNVIDYSETITKEKIIERLSTSEDKFKIHKICGIISLLNIIYRTKKMYQQTQSSFFYVCG